jgi:hypothetical protein
MRGQARAETTYQARAMPSPVLRTRDPGDPTASRSVAPSASAAASTLPRGVGAAGISGIRHHARDSVTGLVPSEQSQSG